MLDAAPTKKKETAYTLPRKANDCISDPASFRPPGRLFDEFWREGELALMFGPPGTGKSVLALQLADAIARGNAIDGMRMPAGRQRVLYVDLQHSDDQFQMRRMNDGGRVYRFSENLHRDRPDDLEKLADWLREAVTRGRYRTVIIDDLTALRSTCDGTRETLPLMRELRRLKGELGISILVVTQSRPMRSGEDVEESSLLRSRILCDVADSVFAIGRHKRRPEWIYLMQVRARSSALYWHRDNAPCARVRRQDDGLLAMHFDERFEPKLDPETRRRIIELKAMQERYSIREMGAMTGLGRSRVERLLKKWRPSMREETEVLIEGHNDGDPAAFGQTTDPPDNAETDPEKDLEIHEVSGVKYIMSRAKYTDVGLTPEEADRLDAEDAMRYGIDLDDLASSSAIETSQTSKTSQTSSQTQNNVFLDCGCKPGVNSDGDFIWIEKEDERGRPLITYQPNGKRFSRWKYHTFGRGGTTVDGPVCIRGGGRGVGDRAGG